MNIFCLIAALVFGLWDVEALIAYFRAPPENKGDRLIIFVYCLAAVLILLWSGGYFPGHPVAITR